MFFLFINRNINKTYKATLEIDIFFHAMQCAHEQLMYINNNSFFQNSQNRKSPLLKIMVALK